MVVIGKTFKGRRDGGRKGDKDDTWSSPSHPQTETQPCPSNNAVACCMHHHHPPSMLCLRQSSKSYFGLQTRAGPAAKCVPACGRASVWSKRRTRRCTGTLPYHCLPRLPCRPREVGRAWRV